MERIENTIRQAKGALRRYARQTAKTRRATEAEAWTADNLPALLDALENAQRAARRRPERLSRLVGLWETLCPDGVLPGEKPLTEGIAAFSPDLSDCGLLAPAAGAYFACAAATNARRELTGDEAAGKTVCACVRSLLALRDVDFDALTASVCEAERLLASDPSGDYETMSDATKALYRRAVIKGAKRAGVSETDFAKAALERAKAAETDRHIGFYLPLRRDRTRAAACYLTAETLFCLAVSLGAALWAGSLWYAVAVFLPVSAALFPLCETLRARLFPAAPLCAMDEEREIGEENAVLIAVTGLLPAADNSDALYEHLLGLHDANRDGCVRLMLLLDKKNAPAPTLPEDAADLAAVRRVIDRLNRACGGGFAAAVRERVWAPTEEEYTGFERKRGAVIALMQYLRDGDGTRFEHLFGETAGLTKTRYVMALDGDTEISFGALRRLVAVACHPLNRAVCDPVTLSVVRGYGCVAPRGEVSLASAGKTFFTRLFTEGGTLTYAPAVSERNMDLFGCSVFTGKGLLDVDAFNCAVGDRFQRGRILSHDALEGAVLRTAFAGECEITEAFPARPDAFFTRMHRWVRGDAQNARYILCPVTETPLRTLLPAPARWHLWQNVKCALTPVFSLGCLLGAPFAPGRAKLLLYAAALLSVSADSLLAGCRAVLSGGVKSLFGRYFSSEMSLSVKCFLRALARIGMLPREGLVCADALLRAAVRSAFTHKHLLRWTTALQADGMTARPLPTGYILPLAAGAALGALGGPFGRLTALLILLATLLSLADGVPLRQKGKRRIGERDREAVRSFAAAAWRYFAENVTAADHHLPPDNVQETPVMRTARRTSPTNIGLYLTSAAAAHDLGLIGEQELLDRLSETLKTVTTLPKYNGCLYNWYDTETLAPLPPAYVSAVDCGNFLCCLTALRGALEELGCERARTLAALTDDLRGACDMGFLYDKQRNLFRIGCDAQAGALSEAHYDLFMSEARMTSFYETAEKHVPAAHMRALGRMLLRCGGSVAASSWTGTLFEYFMPTLFIPVTENSFVYESLRACLAAQKRRMGKLPWGISESCFAAADHAGNYRYKAHGLSSLSLKRLADDEPVIAPYATFLTLPFDFRGAMKNLSAIAALHAQGTYGFYEAVDFTPERTGGEDYCIVRCWMAHHVGMSIVAAANALLDDVFVKRFARDPAMRAGLSLLNEKVPAAPRIYKKQRYRGESPRPEGRQPAGEGDENPFAEAGFYGGEWLLAADRYGRNRSVFSSLEMYRYTGRCRGVTVCARADGRTALLNTAAHTRGQPGETAFTARAKLQDTTVSMGLLVHPSQPALLVPVRVTNRSQKPTETEVTYYFEPLLRQAFREDDHPAFTDLFLRQRFHRARRTLTFTRAHGASLCAGLYSRADFAFETDREKLLPRDPYREAPVCFAEGKAESAAVCPAAAITVRFSLPPGKSAEQVLILTCDFTADGAAERLERVRAARLPRLAEGAANPFARDGFTAPFAAAFLQDVFFGHSQSAVKRDAVQSVTADRSALWAAGISGDLPLLTLRTEACAESAVRAMTRLHKRLATCGVANDLVLLTDAPGDYAAGERTAFDPLLREEDLLGDKGRPGGVYVLREGALSPATQTAVAAFSALLCPDEATGEAPPAPETPRADPAKRPDGNVIPDETPQPDSTVPDATDPPENTAAEAEGAGNDVLAAFSPGGFTVEKPPALPWCHTLSNRSFGTLVSDGSLGFTWAYNSQLNRLTPWSNDVAADNGGERLYLETGVARYDAVWGAKARFTDTQAVWESVCGPFRVTVTAEVPERGAKKRIVLEAENRSDQPQSFTARYRLLPQLSRLRGDAAFVSCKITAEGVVIRNPMNGDFPGAALLYCDRTDACGVGTEPDGARIWPKAEITAGLTAQPGQRVQTVFGLCFAATESAGVLLKRAPFAEKRPRWAAVQTGDAAADRFGSALLLHQVRDARLLARCGFYQCAGGYGFRDQLQDLLALTKRDPQLCREALFKMAAAQFPEGDALHWFHPVFRGGRRVLRGVRTACSDDRLWLPFAAAQYVADTGDKEILRRAVPFLAGEPLTPGEKSRCGEFISCGVSADLYTHCLRCFDNVKTGRHGLPLMGGGDWNDAFDALGEQGKGESVWLAMFLRRCARAFAAVCHIRHDTANRERLLALSEDMAAVCEKYAWAGDRYLRAFTDGGAPVGAPGADQCAADLLTQAWASLADLPDRQKRKAALTTAYRELFDERHGIVKLLDPPFTEDGWRAGYINDYPAGIRENGGQYTHAAVWFLTALRKEGMEEEARRVLRALLPNEKYRSPHGKAVYKTEPYALCGDVYAAPGLEGRGGWSLYTGAAGWLLQYLTE